MTQIPAAAIIAASLILSPAFADADAEREALARVVHELETLEPLIRTAESQANPDARVRFRYEGVVLADNLEALFRSVPPPLSLAQHEKAERAEIMR